MPITLTSRRLGDITIVTCSGRIIEGPESTELKALLDELLPFGPYLVLNLEGIDFIDSSGLGLLVRYLARAKNARGALALCALSPRLTEALRVTHLHAVFAPYDTEAEAIGALYKRPRSANDAPFKFRTDILCVDESADMQAYVRELLGQAGYGVATAGNIPDALILMVVARPKAIVINARLRLARSTASAEKFNRLADALPVIELPADFSKADAGEAGQRLLDSVKALGVS